MASPTHVASAMQQAKANHPPLSAALSGPSSASIILEKARAGVGIRRSTPDSEVFVQSDDEQDHRTRAQNAQVPQNPPSMQINRRASWLNDIPPAAAIPRKTSVAATSSLSGANSYPNTPMGEQGTWQGSITSPTVGSSSTWGQAVFGTGIWNSESTRKDAPSRVTEVLPSPSSVKGGGSGDYFDVKSNSSGMGSAGESAIPFPIPLHPTPKTYRSQSYSVGQLDPAALNQLPPNIGVSLYNARNRNGHLQGLQHRPSRPSMLGNVDENAPLGRLHEEEDDETSEPEDGQPWSAARDPMVKQLALENVLLKQAISQAESQGLQHRASVSSTLSTGFGRSGNLFNQSQLQGGYPQSLDLAVEDTDELNDYHGHSIGRRFSEYSANADGGYLQLYPENRKIESVKRGFWQSSPGIGGFAEPPQSRRHSFADIPTRRGSINSVVGDSKARRSGIAQVSSPNDDFGRIDDGSARSARDDNSELTHFHMYQTAHGIYLEQQHLQARAYAASYFAGLDPSTRGAEVQSPTSPLHSFGMQNPFGRPPQHFPPPHHYHQSLVIVTFKCYRADAFYVQEDTGLQVKEGDLVIVEADRGTDLGTVAHASVSWNKAKELKDKYAEEHYKWLMMFSQHNRNGNPHTVNPNGLGSHGGSQGSVASGMGPPGHHNLQEPGSGELKPKMIKRLAQNHEIQALREKEGNEAKAKRVCQQKVIEHRLNMEILDAEFQMDWKKLTFYYFADTYINFNSLVTDLFKIYKTRIWMSAINPASFATPTTGLQLSSSLNASGTSHGRVSPGERRRHHDQSSYGPHPSSPGFGSSDAVRDIDPLQTGGFINPYMQAYQQIPIGIRPTGLGVSGFGQNSMDSFSFQPSPNGQDHMGEYPNPQNGGVRPLHPIGTEWLNSFQGLSLGS